MTLVLTFVAGSSVLQVSDRLVSRGDSAYDIHGNKSVILLAQNGLAVFGYTGLAYLDGVPTDHWIAEQLLDEEFPQVFGMRVRAGPEVKPPNLGMAVRRLSRKMTMQFSRMSADTELFPRVVVAALQWKRNIVRPIVAEVSRSPVVPGAFVLTYVPRNELRPFRDSAGHLRVPTALACLPGEWLSQVERTELLENLSKCDSIDSCEDVLISAIRGISSRESNKVGADCMSVLIQNREDGLQLRIRYRPVIAYRHPIRMGDSQIEIPAACTPWLLSAGFVQQPQIAIGFGESSFNGLRVQVDAPPLPPDSPLIGALLSQRRKPDPYAPRRAEEWPPPPQWWG